MKDFGISNKKHRQKAGGHSPAFLYLYNIIFFLLEWQHLK
jgi:hypothetical protein